MSSVQPPVAEMEQAPVPDGFETSEDGAAHGIPPAPAFATVRTIPRLSGETAMRLSCRIFLLHMYRLGNAHLRQVTSQILAEINRRELATDMPIELQQFIVELPNLHLHELVQVYQQISAHIDERSYDEELSNGSG